MLPDHQQSHSLSELGHERSSKMGANYWATIWIKGLQNDNVKEAKANGMKAFAYTLDFPFLIRKYMRDGHYDGMVSNRPTIVAYEYYTRP
jgi:glycerophosphoryl diester phosphodiesterase